MTNSVKRLLLVAFIAAFSICGEAQHTLPTLDRNNVWTGTNTGPFVDNGGAIYNVKAYGAKGDGVTDDTVAIQAALTFAGTLTTANTYYTAQVKGGSTVFLPAGTFVTSATLIVPAGVTLVGAGKTSSVILSSVNGPVIRDDMGIGYNWFGGKLSDFAIYGDRTKVSQIGIDLLRPTNVTLSNIYIQAVGNDGVRIRQGISNTLHQVDVDYAVGKGFEFGGGVNSWSDSTANNLPSNNNLVLNCHGNSNDAAGLYLGSFVNGTTVKGGAYENNYASSAANTGFQIELRTAFAFSPNTLEDVWVEGSAQAHVYQDTGNTAIVNKVIRLLHFGNGTAGNVDRAIINNQGTLIIDSPYGSSTAYKTISGSNAPFRLVTPNAIIRIYNPLGNGIADTGQFVEDQTGASPSLGLYLFKNNFNIANSFTAVQTFTVAPVISSITNTGSLTLPTATGTLADVIASGTSTFTTTAVGAGACQTTVTTVASNALTTDTIAWAYATAPTAATDGVLHIQPYVTSGNVNFMRCNPTAGSITPTAIVINWRVIR